MFVASLTAVVLSGSGLVAVLLLDRDGGGTEPAECLLGRWRMVSHTEELSSLGQTVQLTLVGDEGAVYEFRDDGTGSADYGSGTAFQSTSLGQTVDATVSGTLSFRYEASDGTFQVTEMLSTDATFTVDFLGTEVPSPYQLSTTTPENYRCEGDTITFSLPERNYAAEYQRAA
jgi:hypothetical protein